MKTAFSSLRDGLLIKVCGMRDPQNIAEVAALQPDFLGFIFHAPSPRYIAELPKPIVKAVGPRKVGVFVNASSNEIVAIAHRNGLDDVQLHGNESPQQCELLQSCALGVIKAFRLGKTADLDALEAYEGACDAFLFDTKGKLAGGNGVKFDWGILENYHGKTPFFLSGGIGLADAEAILALQHPKLRGIDLNSGFELQPGLKNPQLLQEFLHKIQSSMP
jgi:phosphoribosylanthranilate isomerase